MREKYKFRIATLKDIEQMVQIENQFFNEEVAFNEKFLEKWFLHNSNMFYVVVNSQEKVLAFTILVPITEKLYGDLKRGKVKDLVEFQEQDILQEVQSEYYYIADIASSEKEISATLVLLKGLTEFLGENAHWVIATPITKEGFMICKKFGFKAIESENMLGNNCELEVTNSVRARFLKKKKR